MGPELYGRKSRNPNDETRRLGCTLVRPSAPTDTNRSVVMKERETTPPVCAYTPRPCRTPKDSEGMSDTNHTRLDVG